MVSIITINYNNKAGLQKTLDSIKSQLFKDVELLVIDGGSTDGSVDLIGQYAGIIDYWVSEKDRGIYHAQNKGILQASGDYCFFLNSGDYFASPQVLSTIFEQGPTVDILYGNLVKVYPDKKVVDKGFQSGNLSLYDFYSKNLNHQATFIKRSLFDQHGLYDESYKIVADWLFWVKAIGLGDASVAYYDCDIAEFDMSGISSHQISLRNEERARALKNTLPKNVLSDYAELHQLKWRVAILDKIEKKKLSLFLFKVYRRLFV